MLLIRDRFLNSDIYDAIYDASYRKLFDTVNFMIWLTFDNAEQ